MPGKKVVMPFFSVIIPVFNRAGRLANVLDSLANQSFHDFETIIIDDASTDNTYEVASKHPLTNKLLLKNSENRERCGSRNLGIKAAKGKYICFLDSDDLFLPNHLENFYHFILKNQLPKAMFFSNCYLENEIGVREEKEVPLYPGKNKFAYLLRYTPNPARVCISREILEEIQFDPAIPGIEDLDLWLRIALKYPLIHLPVLTSVYSIHPESYSYGDSLRYEKELNYFHYVFNKSELKNRLPLFSRSRLISKTHYHLAAKYFELNSARKVFVHSLRAFFYHPAFSDVKRNFSIFVMLIYSTPVVGSFIRNTYRWWLKNPIVYARRSLFLRSSSKL